MNKKPTKGRKAPTRNRKVHRKATTVKLNLWAVSVIVVFLVVLIATPLFKRNGYARGEKVPQIANDGYGIDLSHNNDVSIVWDSLNVMTDRNGRMVTDLDAAKEIYPVSFIFIKATEGQSLVDSKFKEYWKQAKDHGIRRGAYHFFRTSKDPKRQAELFIKTVGPLRVGDLPPVLDIETIHKGLGRKQLNDKALVWLQTVEKHYGRKPIVYTYDYFAKDYLSPEILEHYPIWIAHYKASEPIFENWEYWQFSEKATVYGISGPVDISIKRKK